MKRWIFLFALLSSPASAAPVVVFGDSWGSQSATELGAALAAAGLNLTVDNRAIAGTTADQWANISPNALADAVTANPDAQWVWLSVGGNDVVDLHTAGMGGMATARNDTNIRRILDNLYARHPYIRVVMFGYDYTYFVQPNGGQDCPTQANMWFGPGTTQAQINSIFFNQVGQVMAGIDPVYDFATYVPLWGTMQQAGGQQPNAAQPSPVQYMADCIHPNSQGYRNLHDTLVARYWNTPRPTADLVPPAGTICVNQPVNFTGNGTNVITRRWRVDDMAVAGNQPTLAVTFTTPGQHQVQLLTFNVAWSATDTEIINVSPCVDAGVPDTGVLDLGTPDNGVIPDTGVPDNGIIPDAGFPDNGIFPDTGFPDNGIFPDAEVPDTGAPDGGFIILDSGPPLDLGDDWEIGGGCQGMPGAAAWWLLILPGLTRLTLGRRRP